MEGRRGGNIMRKKCPTCLSKQAFPAIECSFCRYQFHLYCLGIVSDPPLDIEVFYCSNCERKYNKETKIMTDHLDFLKDVSEEPRRIGSKEFLENFKKKTFLSADDIPIVRLAGKDANLGYIETHGFETPILVHSSDGLRLKVPNQDFSYKDLLENIGPLKELIVIDVSRQKEEVMYLRELVEYLSRDERPKAINMLSLEFSSTRLNSFVDPPDLVLEMSWISKFWKLDEQNMPQVQKYCLVSMAGSYTDFHIDFSGSSVWYHVIRGEKKFYLIRPTPENLEKFKNWMKDDTQPYKYFGDCVDHCYEVHIKQGETVFIPSGWIHAVLTPVDSLVFGGNFLNSFNVEMQLRIYDLEEKLSTASKYTFPSFRSVNWQVAYHIRNAALGTNKAIKRYLLENLRSLHPHLVKWSQDVVNPPPQEVNHSELLKEMEIIIGAAWKDDGFGCCTIDSDYMPSPRKKRRRCLNAFIRN